MLLMLPMSKQQAQKALIQTAVWLVSFVATGNIFVLKTEKYDLKNFEDDQQRKQSIKC